MSADIYWRIMKSLLHALTDSIGMFPFKKRAVIACVHEASGHGDSQRVYIWYTDMFYCFQDAWCYNSLL